MFQCFSDRALRLATYCGDECEGLNIFIERPVRQLNFICPVPIRDRIKRPTAEPQSTINKMTRKRNADASSCNFKVFCVFFNTLSMNGARAAAPATRKGLVKLFPVHIDIIPPRHAFRLFAGFCPVLFSKARNAMKKNVVYVMPLNRP